MSYFPTVRSRRLRGSTKIRNLVSETRLDVDKLIMPIFIKHGSGLKNPVASMPGIYQLSLDQLETEVMALVEAGIKSVLLFGIPAEKDSLGSDSYADNGIIQQAIPIIKKAAPNLLVITDVCFCEYTDHGHCELEGDNDKTIALLGKQAVSHVKAGADVVAPSGSIDGMVGAVRTALDAAGYPQLPVMSYAVKYASGLYGPFRQAAEGAPKFGDRAGYQADPRNASDALRECELDVAEGADMLMVKPALAYLDIIYQVKQAFPALPLGAYQVSGEYAMIKAAAANGWIDEKRVVLETLTAIHRAGADFIITYYAKEVAGWLT